MNAVLSVAVVAAQESPGGSAVAILLPPAGVLIFLGTVYLLLRSNLGTRRGYLVLGTCFFGFLFLMSLFWGFGAPGTPRATGPTNLPSQQPDHYQPRWTPFAIDSRVAATDNYQFVRSYPQGFGEVPDDFADRAELGVDDVRGFFSAERGGSAIGAAWDVTEVLHAEAPNGFPVIAVTFQQTYQPAPLPEGWTQEDPPLTPDGRAVAADEANLAPPGTQAGDLVPDGAQETLFGFFNPGSILFPSLVLAAISLVLFLLHAFLLDRDEAREKRETAEATPERERVPAGA